MRDCPNLRECEQSRVEVQPCHNCCELEHKRMNGYAVIDHASVGPDVYDGARVLSHRRARPWGNGRELFRCVMGTIVVLFNALSPASIAMLLDQSQETIASPLGRLHSLLDVPEEEDRLIRLLHPSFREFLLDSRRCTNATFCIDAKEAHRHLFECCLRVMSSCLRQDICDLRRPGTRVGDVYRLNLNKNVPFTVQYACRYWVYHLKRSDVDPQEHRSIVEVFEAQFLFWLEILALIGQLADRIAML